MNNQDLESQILQNQLPQSNLVDISRESIYMGIFEGSKILLIAFAAGLFIRFIYKKFSTSYSSKDDYGNTILIITISVAALIAVVKSSLALSLGLVGALSVVRFRTAVKEPINLGFLLFAICVGITIGASQVLFALITIFIGSISIILIYFKTGVKNEYSNQKESSVDTVSITLSDDSDLDVLINLIKEESKFFEIQTLEDCSKNKTIILIIKIKFNNIKSLNNLRIKIKSKFKESKILFFNSPIY